MSTTLVTPVNVTVKMVSVMVDLFGNDLQDPSNFHHMTLKALAARGLVWSPITSPYYTEENNNKMSGYVFLTSAGEKWLTENRYAIVVDGIRLIASTHKFSHEYITGAIRAHHIRAALAEYNAVEQELVGQDLIHVVDDALNNVSRRCNIRMNDDAENRCWEIMAQFNFYSNPTTDTLYLMRYVGVEHIEYYNNHTSVYFMTDLSALTNLY